MLTSINLKDLTRLGIKTENQLNSIFSKALNEGSIMSSKTNEFGTTVMRSVDIGTKGRIEVGFFYAGSNMNSAPAVSTIIPKVFR